MSSVTSTSVTAGGVQKQADPDVRLSDRPTESGADQGFRPWHFFVLASLMAATAAVIMSRPSTPAHLILISLTIGAAGAAAAGFYRMLAPLAAGEAAIPGSSAATSERARLALEREKALVLRSIKELEFDRAMGKLSPKDFDEMAGRLRARALMLMKEVDEGSAGYRDIIERELSARMAARGARASLAAGTAKSADAADADLQVAAGDGSAGLAATNLQAGHCPACATANDEDASFCKRCGARLAGSHA